MVVEDTLNIYTDGSSMKSPRTTEEDRRGALPSAPTCVHMSHSFESMSFTSRSRVNQIKQVILPALGPESAIKVAQRKALLIC